MCLCIAAFTHQGHIRKNNEDTVDVGSWIRNSPMTTPSVFRVDACIPIDGKHASAFNLGDGRAYKVRKRILSQISVDDADVCGSNTNRQKTGVITQSLGDASDFVEVDPHIRKLHLLGNDAYLLCSDGLSDMLTPDSIRSCFCVEPAESTERLFESAMAAGGDDNISIVVVSFI